MDYCSTRDNSIRAASAEAIAAGISKEGGLFVPCEFPRITYQDLCEMETDDYKTRAQKILSRFLTLMRLKNVWKRLTQKKNSAVRKLLPWSF